MRLPYKNRVPVSRHKQIIVRWIKYIKQTCSPLFYKEIDKGLFGEYFDSNDDDREGRYLQLFKRAHELGREVVDWLYNEEGLSLNELMTMYEKSKNVAPSHYDEEWYMNYPNWYQDEHDRIDDEYLNGFYERIFELR